MHKPPRIIYFVCVCDFVCEYYFAVIVTDFLMRAKKILKLLFYSRAHLV